MPEEYIEWIPRVSSLVEMAYPFEWFAKENYKKWLKNNWIDADEYLKEAQDVGTAIHLEMENHLLNRESELTEEEYEDHIEEVVTWRKFVDMIIDKHEQCKLIPEEYVRDENNHYQWTIDLIIKDEDRKIVYLYDYKTWEIARKRWWLETKLNKNWRPPKPSSKLKKLALQLSLYARTYIQQWYTIWWLFWVWIHQSWVHCYEVDMWWEDELSKLIQNYLDKQNYITF